MIIADFPENEEERLRALHAYSILDTLAEDDFDNLTRLASEICETPISLVSLIDQNRQWFKSSIGLDLPETSRDIAFCSHAINSPDDVFIIKDSRTDIRFFDNPLVTGEPHVIFYAGVPLIDMDGFALGTLCIIDNKPHELTLRQRETLKSLAHQIVRLFELRKKNRLLEEAQQEIQVRNIELEQLVYVVSHDLKSPLNNISSLAKMIEMEHSHNMDAAGKKLIGHIGKSAARLKNMVDGIIEYYIGSNISSISKNTIYLTSFLEDIVDMLDLDTQFKMEFPIPEAIVVAHVPPLRQIFLNIISNAMKYNDKAQGVIIISFSENTTHYFFSVADNGSGIPTEQQPKIFDIFFTLGKKDRFDTLGTGIGLATLKRLVEKLGGKISVKSEVGIGSVFTFSISK